MAMDHVGVAVPDLAAAKAYYDELLPLVGLHAWFPADEFQCNYGPVDGPGTQLFLYRADEQRPYRRGSVGLQHLAFGVRTRSEVDAVHAWVVGRGDTVVHPPRLFPEYGEHCYATFFDDPHGFRIEVVTHEPAE